MQKNEEDVYVLLGSPVSLVCGYNLIGNPSAVISWTDPQNKQVINSDRYWVDTGPTVVQLNITEASKMDNGTWRCTVNVSSSYNSFDPMTSNFYSEAIEIEISLTVVGEYIILSMKLILHKAINCTCIS